MQTTSEEDVEKRQPEEPAVTAIAGQGIKRKPEKSQVIYKKKRVFFHQKKTEKTVSILATSIRILQKTVQSRTFQFLVSQILSKIVFFCPCLQNAIPDIVFLCFTNFCSDLQTILPFRRF